MPFSTMFTTASGKAVTITAEALEKSKQKYVFSEEGDVPERDPQTSPTLDTDCPSSVGTLFSTALGTPVTVRSDSLRNAQVKILQRRTDGTEGARISAGTTVLVTSQKTTCMQPLMTTATPTLLSELPVGGFITPGTADRLPPTIGEDQTSGQGAGSPTDSALATNFPSRPFTTPNRQAAPTSRGTGRRGFVPPTRVDRPTVDGPSASSSRHVNAIKRISLRAEDDGTPPVEAPPLAAIVSGTFSFERRHCSDTLLHLLGLAEGDAQVRVGHWRRLLLTLGAIESHCSTQWCQQMVMSSLVEARRIHLTEDHASAFSIHAAATQLCAKYNEEIVNGARPALRKVVEGDVPAASLMVLYLSSISEDYAAPHMRIVRISDGFYHLKVQLDVPLTNLVREGRLRSGAVLSICGSKLLLQRQCHPTECIDEVILALQYNCVRQVAADTELGFCHAEPPPLPLHLVHPMGGLVSALEGVVTRVLPPFFIAQHPSPAAKIVRNFLAQCQADDRLAVSDARQPTTHDANTTSGSQRLSRVSSLTLEGPDGTALIQYWESCANGCTVTGEDYSLPQEGTTIIVYALNPSRTQVAVAPFGNSKVFFSPRSLHFVTQPVPVHQRRHIVTTAAAVETSMQMGSAIDVAGLFLEDAVSEQGRLVVLQLLDGSFVLLQVPLPTPTKALAFTTPSAAGMPLLILNATLVHQEDPQVGSDCMRLFASEFTAVTQRATGAYLKEVWTEVSSSLLRKTTRDQKIVARLREIIRCASTPPSLQSNGRGPAATSIISYERDTPIRETTEHRVPYYMRSGAAAPAAQPRGVVIPRPSNAASPVSAAPSAASPPGFRDFHFYGNIVRLTRCVSGGASYTVYSEDGPSVYPLQLRTSNEKQPSPACFEVTWRYASQQDTCTARIQKPAVLEELLEPAISMSKLLTFTSDEKNIEVALQRSETIARCAPSERRRWWTLMNCSFLCPVDGLSGEEEGGVLLWMDMEWRSALTALKGALTHCLYKFTLHDGMIDQVHYITDKCNVAAMF